MAYTFKHGDRPVEGYTIQRAVGKGGFGEVYYAVSDGGREVALKYLRDNPQVELRGVSHCINLKSPHLVSIFDVKKTTDGEYVIIMEYCSGPSLRDLLIAEPSGFEPQKAAFFLREIAKGLAYLHDRGIVHRDLKPGNIFYDDGYVKIGDYGLSKFISVSRHSAQTASVGTVHYMAPEIGSGNYSKGVDIYALGVMLYEMLLGKVPFEGSSMAEVLMKHLTTQPEVDHLPEPFGRVIRKALQKDPNDRYQSVDEMVEELLEVATVRESLAGFSTKSLEGAVRGGEPAGADSPMPSPNPVPGLGLGYAQPPADIHGQTPYAYPVGAGAALPKRVAKRMDRISRKMESKMAKLGGGRPRQVPPPPPRDAGQAEGVPRAPFAPAIAPSDRRKRMLLSGFLSIGLGVGLGVLVGTTSPFGEDAGVSAGLLVVALSGGILLSRKVVAWFGAECGPIWSQRLIRLCCCTPLLAIGAAPLLDSSRYSDVGAALWIGLLILAVLVNWEKTIEDASAGEMRFGRAVGMAVLGMVSTVALAGMFGTGNKEHVMLIGAGVAGLVSLILQSTAWWLPARAGRAATPSLPDRWQGEGSDSAGSHGATVEPPWSPLGPPLESGDSVGAAYTARTTPDLASHPRLRWGVTRAFWGLVAFVLTGGAIVTFLYPLVATGAAHHDITLSIVLCTSFASFMIFALRKTTPSKRDGLWRETVRPFLISAMLAGIGGTITGIASEWDHSAEWGRCVTDEGRVALISGLVMCSILFLGLTLFTGRRRRSPKPFVLVDVGRGTRGDAAATSRQVTEAATDPEESEPAT
jgi:hypothetical protein